MMAGMLGGMIGPIRPEAPVTPTANRSFQPRRFISGTAILPRLAASAIAAPLIQENTSETRMLT